MRFLFALWLLLPGTALAVVRFIPTDAPTIQEGIGLSSDGDTVQVLPGTYIEHEIDLLGKAVVLRSNDPSDSAVVASTVIDGDLEGTVLYLHSGEDTTTVIEGFTIQHGYGVDVDNESFGGGITIRGASPRISNCAFRENWSHNRGGALDALVAVSTLQVEDCVFQDNTAIYRNGGAVYADATKARFVRCVFRNNYSFSGGGGLYIDTCRDSVWVSSSVFVGNESGGGGAIDVTASDLIIEESVVAWNRAVNGGGIIGYGGGDITMRNCVIYGNRAERNGGGIQVGFGDVNLSGVLIFNNSVERFFGGGLVLAYVDGIVENCTVVGNHSHDPGGGIFGSGDNPRLALRSLIVRDNSPDQILAETTPLYIDHSNIEGGYQGWGNIDADPLFMEAYGFPYLLHPASPCIDAGYPGIHDQIFDSHPLWPDHLPNGQRADMGAYGGPFNQGWWRLRGIRLRTTPR